LSVGVVGGWPEQRRRGVGTALVRQMLVRVPLSLSNARQLPVPVGGLRICTVCCAPIDCVTRLCLPPTFPTSATYSCTWCARKNTYHSSMARIAKAFTASLLLTRFAMTFGVIIIGVWGWQHTTNVAAQQFYTRLGFESKETVYAGCVTTGCVTTASKHASVHTHRTSRMHSNPTQVHTACTSSPPLGRTAWRLRYSSLSLTLCCDVRICVRARVYASAGTIITPRQSSRPMLFSCRGTFRAQ
jgi:hypothetical protein